MSESEIEGLVIDARTVAGRVFNSNRRIDDMLKRAARVAERVRVMRDHQQTLDDLFLETSDGVRRRQLLEELQKENRERLKCREENHILHENLCDGFIAFEEIFHKNRVLQNRIASEAPVADLQSVLPATETADEVERHFVRGQREAEVKSRMRMFAKMASELMQQGEEEAANLMEFTTQMRTRNEGLREVLDSEQGAQFAKLFNSEVPRLRQIMEQLNVESGDEREEKDEHPSDNHEMQTSIVKRPTESNSRRKVTVQERRETVVPSELVEHLESECSEEEEIEESEMNRTIVDVFAEALQGEEEA